jgi:hypothetical protein
MIVMAIIGGVIVAGFAWAGWYDYRRRKRGTRTSVAENFNRQREIDRQSIADKAAPMQVPAAFEAGTWLGCVAQRRRTRPAWLAMAP